MRRVELMDRMTRIVKAAGWVIYCPRPPYPHTRVIHWSDRIGPQRHAPLLTVRDRDPVE
jgi:hypothetical protein